MPIQTLSVIMLGFSPVNGGILRPQLDPVPFTALSQAAHTKAVATDAINHSGDLTCLTECALSAGLLSHLNYPQLMPFIALVKS